MFVYCNGLDMALDILLLIGKVYCSLKTSIKHTIYHTHLMTTLKKNKRKQHKWHSTLNIALSLWI